MLINAGVMHPHPLWLDRLRDGGRLVVPITMSTTQTLGSGVMIRITREQGGFPCRVISPVAIYSCTSLRTPETEPLLRKAFTTQSFLKLRSLRRDAHEPAASCLVHGPTLCLSSAGA
jgi:protein-L-isoaspartate(D-aspartate) O-methyltransferase